MSCYLTAFSGRFAKNAIPGFWWTHESSRNAVPTLDILRHENPWLAAVSQGPRIFTLTAPDDPEGAGLGSSAEGELRLDGHRSVGQVLEILLFKALASAGERVDLQGRFLAFGSRQLTAEKAAVDGVRLQLRLQEDRWILWMHPVRRVIDGRSLPEALKDRRGRPSTLWFAAEGLSAEGLLPRVTDTGIQIQTGRRARLLPAGAPIFMIMGEEQPDLEPRRLIESARRFLAAPALKEAGFEFDSSPLSLEELGFQLQDVSAPEAQVMDRQGALIPLGEHYRRALAGGLSERRSEVPATFHFTDVKDESGAEELALHLNQKAATWECGIQFATEPLPGSQPVSLGAGAKTAVHIEPGSPLLMQPQSGRAAGQMGAILLECVRLAGGTPWKLAGDSMRPTLGIAHALLHGRQHHVAAVYCDETGTVRGGCVLPMRLSDLQGPELARGLRHRLPELPENLLILLAEDLSVSTSFLDEFVKDAPTVRVDRLAMPWGIDASSYGWLKPETMIVSSSRLSACLAHPGGGLRMLGLESVRGEVNLPQTLGTVLALEHAWAPGRVEQRLSPAPLEWARGLLFQRSRFEAFLNVRSSRRKAQ